MYIVTGGAGFIGSVLIRELNKRGITDIIVVDNLGESEKWRNLVKCHYAYYVHRDEFKQQLSKNNLPWSVEAVIHLGACSSTTERNMDFLMQNNLQYSQELCYWTLQQSARFINASSAATYGLGQQGFSDDLAFLTNLRPLNPYGYSKHLFDLWLLQNNLLEQVVSLKFFNVFGPNEYHKGNMRSMAIQAYEQIKATNRLRLFKSTLEDLADGEQKRDFIFVKDCIAVILWFLDNPNINGIYNVGTGKARSFNDLAKAAFLAMNKPCQIDYIDMPESLKKQYQNFTEADMTWLKIHNCQIKFTDLEEAIRIYLQDYLMQDDAYF